MFLLQHPCAKADCNKKHLPTEFCWKYNLLWILGHANLTLDTSGNVDLICVCYEGISVFPDVDNSKYPRQFPLLLAADMIWKEPCTALAQHQNMNFYFILDITYSKSYFSCWHWGAEGSLILGLVLPLRRKESCLVQVASTTQLASGDVRTVSQRYLWRSLEIRPVGLNRC